MKRYLFGLGTMIVGAGLMFVLMHGEVSADDVNKVKCEVFESDTSKSGLLYFDYCKIKDLTCVSSIGGGLSCVKS